MTKLQRLTEALLANRAAAPSRHNIIPCFVCGHTFVFKGPRRALNGNFCSLRCQDWYDAGNAPITYRWRDDMQKTADGFKISCAHCRKDFESKGLRCCSGECERSYREREANLAVMPRWVSRQTPSVAACAVVPLLQLGAMAAEYRNLSAFALTNAENGSQGPRPDFVRANLQKAPVVWGYFGRPLMTSGAQTKGHT